MGTSVFGAFNKLNQVKARKQNSVTFLTSSELGTYRAGDQVNIRIKTYSIEPNATFSLASGTLPTGLTLVNSNTVGGEAYIVGTMPTVSTNTLYTFTIKVDLTISGQAVSDVKTFRLYQNADNLVYYWTFNRPNTSIDGSPTVGTLSGGSVAYGHPVGPDGTTRNFLKLLISSELGGSSWNVGSTLNFMNTQDFTIEGYFYSTATLNAQTLLSVNGNQLTLNFGAPSADGLNWVSALGRCTLKLGNTTYEVGGIGLKTRRWNHFALVRNNNQLKVFLNGKTNGTVAPVGTILSAVSPFASSAKLSIGENYSITHQSGEGFDVPNGTFSGFVGEFRVWDKAVYTSNFTKPWGSQMPSNWGEQSTDSGDWNFPNWNN